MSIVIRPNSLTYYPYKKIKMPNGSSIKKRKQIAILFLYTICCFFFGSLLVSCSADSVYEKNVDLNNRIWLADSTIDFTFKIADATPEYDIYYNFRNTVGYPYQNLYVSYNLENEDGQVLLTALENIALFDAKTGKPYGNGLGDIFSHEYKAISGYQFPDSGSFTLKIQQYMRKDTLPEVLTVGVSIKKESE